jgi:hypothetical protein
MKQPNLSLEDLKKLESVPDVDGASAEEDFKFNNKIDLDNRREDAEVAELEDMNKLRRKFTFFVKRLIKFWVGLVVIILALSGFKLFDFELSSSVIIAFLTTTTTSIIALPAIILGGLFKSKKSKKKI